MSEIRWNGPSSSLLDRIIAANRWWERKNETKGFIRRAHKRLQNLTPEEVALLRNYVANRTKSQWLPYESGVVMGLVRLGIIYQASSLGNIHPGYAVFQFNINDFAWEYLHQHPEVIGFELPGVGS